MAILELNSAALRYNYDVIDTQMKSKNISWGVVTKILCGTRPFLAEILKLNPSMVLDSRLSNLAKIKAINPHVTTAYIKPPPKRILSKILEVADISFNTQYETLAELNALASKKEMQHRVVIMIEMGELREGIMRDSMLHFFEKVLGLAQINVIGIGTNLTCMNGILPTHETLLKLSQYKDLIEARFNFSIPLISAGTSITLPFLNKNLVPASINHFRLGETLFLGNDLLEKKKMKGLRDDVFILKAEIIEVLEKPPVPFGRRGKNLLGQVHEPKAKSLNGPRWRILVDVGNLDMNPDDLSPLDSNLRIDGASSDILALELALNISPPKTGDFVRFRVNYMGALRLMGSYYVEKRIV